MRVIGNYADLLVREEAVVEVRAFDDAVREEVVGAPEKDPVVLSGDCPREGEACDDLSRWHEREGKGQGQTCA